MAPPRIELGLSPRERDVLPLDYGAVLKQFIGDI